MNDLPQDSWERIKNLEKNNKISIRNTLDQIENNMPTIIRSIKIQKKAASLNFDWINKDQVLKKVDEELNELKEALQEKNKKNIEDELGDLFFTLISLSRHLNLDPDQTLRKANQKFINRFNEMENIVEDKKLKWHSLRLIDFKNLWNKAKKKLREV
jgi:MazG family protein